MSWLEISRPPLLIEESAMTENTLTRRTMVGGVSATAVGFSFGASAETPVTVKVWKDPNCGCCTGWAEHLGRNGFVVTVTDTAAMQEVKGRLGVPRELASCHTAEVGGYVIEGHVPAHAIKRLIAEKSAGRGIAVPGMPIGSPGMEGGTPEIYDVILFGQMSSQIFGRYKGDQPV
jgi:hypothetical protein